MASDYYDMMHIGVDQFAYLKCPSKIRAAIINAGGKPVSVETIKQRLNRPSKVEGANIGEPHETDGEVFQVRSLVPAKPVVGKSAQARDLRLERNRIAALAALIPDRVDGAKDVTGVRPPKPPVAIPKAATNLIDRVCDELGVTPRQFNAGRRKGLAYAASALVAVLLRERNPDVYTCSRLAGILGRRDHTTILHLVDQFEVCCRRFPEVAELYLTLRGEAE